MRPPRPFVKTAVFAVRMTEDRYSAYKAAAALEGRTLTSWVEWHLDLVAGLRTERSTRRSTQKSTQKE